MRDNTNPNSTSKLTVTYELFDARLWDALCGGIVLAGGPDERIAFERDYERLDELPDGTLLKRKVSMTVHDMAINCADPTHVRAVTAVLGRGWQWARQTRRVDSAALPLRGEETLCYIGPLKKRTRRATDLNFQWKEEEFELHVTATFSRASARAIADITGMFPQLATKVA